MIQNTNTLLTTGQTIVLLSALILADLIFYYEVELNGNTKIYDENHFLENTQVVILFICTAAYLQAMLYIQKSQRLVLIAGALFCLSCILREVDIEKHDFPQLIILLGSGYGRNILLISLWLLVAVLFSRNYRHHRQMAVSLLASRSGQFVVAGGLLLVVGSLFEDRVFNVKFYAFYEELSELNGYYFILLGSLNLFFDLQHSIKTKNAAKLIL